MNYANKVKRHNVRYWEIGNENYGAWEADKNTRPHDPATYATRFKEYWRQMKAVDPLDQDRRRDSFSAKFLR